MGLNYDKLPTRGKITSDGEQVKNCVCGGRRYVEYEEARLYHIFCESCDLEAWKKCNSLDEAIKHFNELSLIN